MHFECLQKSSRFQSRPTERRCKNTDAPALASLKLAGNLAFDLIDADADIATRHRIRGSGEPGLPYSSSIRTVSAIFAATSSNEE